MEFLINALSAIPAAAASPYALSAYALTIAAYVAVVFRVTRNKQLLASLEKLPATDRAQVLETEMRGYRLASGISPEQYLRAQIQRYLLVAFLVTIVLAAAITMLGIWRGTAASRSEASQRPSEPEITLRSLEAADSEFRGNPLGELHIKTVAQFQDPQWNTSAYLAALNNLHVTGLTFASGTNQGWELRSYKQSWWDAGTHTTFDRGQVISEAEVSSYLASGGDALAGATLHFQVGPVPVSGTIDHVKWRVTHGPGHDATIGVIEALIKLPPPTWAFIRQARILRTETPGQSILNIFVENMSAREIAVSELTLYAVQDMPSVSCGSTGGTVPITPIHLDWKRIISVAEKGDSAPIGWTKLSESRIPITGSFQQQPNPCSGSPPYFDTSVPMDYVIPASKVLSIDFQIDESPGARHPVDFGQPPTGQSPVPGRDQGPPTKTGSPWLTLETLLGRPAPPPADLSSWDHVLVGFGEHGEVYPRQFQVELPSKR